MVKKCSVCQASKPEADFSKRQWSAKAHGRKCLRCSGGVAGAEGAPAARGAASAEQAPRPPGMPELLGGQCAQTHVPGRLVLVKGLVKAHEHNGKLATTLSLDAGAPGRVKIATNDGKNLSVKHANIEAACLACHSAGVFACGRCKTATFCSPACQAAVWLKHENECGHGKLARADCQDTLRRSETVYFVSRCDGRGAYMIAALHHTNRGGTILAWLLVGIRRGILDAFYEASPSFQGSAWTSAAAIKPFFEGAMFDDNKDAGGTSAGTVRESHRRIGVDLARALALHAEAETDELNPGVLRTNPEIRKALDVFRHREGGAGSTTHAALLADPLLGSPVAVRLKDLFSSFLDGYQCGVRVVQLMQEKNQRLLDWYGIVYNMLHCRGEYRYCFSFCEFAQAGPWPGTWLPEGTSDAQKLEAALLGMSQHPACRARRGGSGSVPWVDMVSPMMKHMSLWHVLGGEDNLAAITALAAEDADTCWHTSAIAVALMIAGDPHRFQRHVSFSFASLRDRLHREFLLPWAALSLGSYNELYKMYMDVTREQQQQRARGHDQERNGAAARPEAADATRMFVDKASGHGITLGPGFTDEDIKEFELAKGWERGAGGRERTRNSATCNVWNMDELKGVSDELGFEHPMMLLNFCSHVSNRRPRTEAPAIAGFFDADGIAALVRSAIPDQPLLALQCNAGERPRDPNARSGLAPRHGPPADVATAAASRRQLADVYQWGLKGSRAVGESEEARRVRSMRAVELMQEAADMGDREAMCAFADYSQVALARLFDQTHMQDIMIGQAHLPPMTKAVRESDPFKDLVWYLGAAAAKGWVSPMTLQVGLVTFGDPATLHGVEGGEHITAAMAEQSQLYLMDVRARAQARGREVRQTAEQQGLHGAESLRSRGNDLFRQHKIKQARTEYSKAVEVAQLVLERQRVGAGQAGGLGEDEQAVRETLVKTLANRAECNLLLSKFADAFADVLSARQGGWHAMPAELADKLSRREERARDGLSNAQPPPAIGAPQFTGPKPSPCSASKPAAVGVRDKEGNRGGDDEEQQSQQQARSDEDGAEVGRKVESGASGAVLRESSASSIPEPCARRAPGGGRGGRKGDGRNRKAGNDAATANVDPEVGEEKVGGVEVDQESENGARPASEEEDCDECLVCLSPAETWKPFKTLTCCSCHIHVDCLQDWKENCEKQNFPKTCPQCKRPCPEVSDTAVAEGLLMSKFGR